MKLEELAPVSLDPESPVAKEALKRLGTGGTGEGNATFLAVLSADPEPRPAISKFIVEAQKSSREKHSILKIAQELGTPPAEIFLSYARGIQTLGHAIAVEKASEAIAGKIDKAIASLLDEAIPKEASCDACAGEGKRGRHSHLTCYKCGGTGKMLTLPQNWAFAQKRIYELAGIGPQTGGIVIQQTNTSNVKGPTLVVGGGFMEKVATLSDDLVSRQLNVVDVTPTNVLTEGHRTETQPGGEGDGSAVGPALQPEEA